MTLEDEARALLTEALQKRSPALANSVLRGDVMATASLSRIDFTAEMAQQVQDDVWGQVERLVDKQIVAFDPSYQTSPAQVLVEPLSGIPDLEAVDQAVRRGDFANDAGGESVVAMAHAVGAKSRKVVAYRVKGPGIATRRPRGVLQLIPRDGIYEPVQGEILYYEPRFDILTCGDLAYFVSVNLLESKLNAPEKARALARDTLKQVVKKVEIDGFADLEQAVMNDPTMRSKMAQIARLIAKEPQYLENLSTKALVRFVEANPDYDILLVKRNGRQVLSFDRSPQRRHQIPKLLADDYLRSELTNRKYDAGSKHRVGQ